MKTIFVFALILLLASCGNIKHSNFNRQKFTELNTQKQSSLNTQTEAFFELSKKGADSVHQESHFDLTGVRTNYSSLSNFTLNDNNESRQPTLGFLPDSEFLSTDDTLPCDTIYLKNGEVLICRIQNFTSSEISFQYCNDNAQTYILSREKVQTFSTTNKSGGETKKTDSENIGASQTDQKVTIGNRRDFEKLSQHGQNQSILNFNRLYNAGWIMFLVALFFGLAGLLYIYVAFVALALIFAMWIMSFVALNKVRRIDLTDQPKKLKNKIRLAQVVCGIGVTVCIVTVVGGVVLLLLWLARII